MVWSNGAELSRQFVEELSTTAVDRIVEYGTKSKAKPAPADKEDPDAMLMEHGETGGGIAGVSENADGSGTLTLKDGTVLKYSGVRTMTATAYTSGHDGVGTRTASGTAVHVGSVAVDKSVIPLGTRMYIVAGGSVVYGLAVAEDTGVKGNKIDLFYDTYEECIQFGRRTSTVYIPGLTRNGPRLFSRGFSDSRGPSLRNHPKPEAESPWELSILSIAVRAGNRYNRYDLSRRRAGSPLPGNFV